jgi:hypothetical protein
MATTKTSSKVAAQVVAEVAQATQSAITFKCDNTLYIETIITFGMVVIGSGKDSLTINDSETQPGMKNIIFTAFNPAHPNSSGVSVGFHVDAATAKAFSDFVMNKVAEKKAQGLNPNTMVFSFESLPGNFIPGEGGNVSLKWFTGVDLSTLTFYVGMEGPNQAGTSEEEVQGLAHENWKANNKAAKMLREFSEQNNQPKAGRKTAQQMLAEVMAAKAQGLA